MLLFFPRLVEFVADAENNVQPIVTAPVTLSMTTSGPAPRQVQAMFIKKQRIVVISIAGKFPYIKVKQWKQSVS